MNLESWILLDTETTGIKAPVYVVELAAQRMRGWTPEGPSFRRLLNHNAAIPPEASRVNGYTREILERDGEPPRQVYDAFDRYVGERPLVAYNLRHNSGGQCGLARPRVLAGGNPAWVIVRREPSIEPCGVDGNGHVDA
ncbi:MAG: 3'-5' exonuclease [Thiocapsa sp.]|uniref:3'-5' exonuclease n=1 Tax=Thiocapsa sp. TaxID=2024551 RepID=UPI001BCEA5E9|nr:3'-5' exonuclease [Thiocapsa sp.]QVL49538.1 MAG: 3'-5' exonuclease [Thiocapsa sp.]